MSSASEPGARLEAAALTDVDVPFVDLWPGNSAVKERVLLRVAELIDRGDFTNGAAVAEFEEHFAAHCEREHCVGVSSGLDALRLALLASGLEEGSGVVVPASTFVASVEAVLQSEGTPIVVDVTGDDLNIDVAQVEGSADAASHVMPVHLYGQMADMLSLQRSAERSGLVIVEDACQAHGARRDQLLSGGAGLAAAFSFYPTKNLGAMGDAGAIVTDDEQLAARARALRVHGELRKYDHEVSGYTARLDTIQAIVLLEKLPLLAEWNRQRRSAAAYYLEALASIDGLTLPPVPRGSDPVWHLFVVRTRARPHLAAFLAERGVQTGRHYPQPVHLAPAFRNLGYARGDFPVAESLADDGLSLPLYPGVTEQQLERVCTTIHDYFSRA
jgi:dTDP-4-amino-4,6-dideoxygalactose transaminase